MSFDIQDLKGAKWRSSWVGRLWRWGRTPQTIPIAIRAPNGLSNIDGILSLFPRLTPDLAEVCRMDFLRNHTFFQDLNRELVERRHRRTNCEDWNEFLYMVIRLARPKTVIETGVFDGVSSAVILQALKDNGEGALISIDLPARETILGSTHRMTETALPPGASPGWVVPEYLKQRHRLVLGDSREWLPKLLQEYPIIDVFFHDSLHTFEHQHFEYTTAWPHIADGGLLLSDDIFWNSAFHRFCRGRKRSYIHVDGFGAVRK